MTFPNDGTCVVEKQYSNEKVSTVFAESRQARKHLQKLGKVVKTVAAHRLKELNHLQAAEKPATCRRTCGFDRIGDDDNDWAHRPFPLAPEQFTANLWSDLIELKDPISMPVRDGSRQRENSFVEGIEQSTASFSDEEFVRIKRRFMEMRGSDAAQVTVTPVDTVQYCSPRSPISEPSSDVDVCTGRNEEGREDP